MTSNYLLFQSAIAIFAVTGVLAAARQNMDVMSFVIVGALTALGGGTLRDLVLDRPVFWLQDAIYLYVAAGASVAAFFFEQFFRATYRAFLYLDAIGAAVFAIISAERTIALGFSPAVAVIMGVLTAIGGGVLRDLMTGQPSLVTRRELYMTPILLGVALYFLLIQTTSLDPAWVAAMAIVLIASLRAGAIRWGWGFPDWLTYRPLHAE